MIQILREQLQKKGQKAPFLFIYHESPELYYKKLYDELTVICKEYWVDPYNIYKLERDNEQSHKINSVKDFILKWNIRPNSTFQIFVFEDFSRLTVQSQNASLKFLEEPGEYNIIILTASSRRDILETILSRVQIYRQNISTVISENPFFISLIKSALDGDKENLIRYFFSKKLEKYEYVDFLKTLLFYLVKQGIYPHLHQKLHDDILWIESNNFIARSIVDIYILEL